MRTRLLGGLFFGCIASVVLVACGSSGIRDSEFDPDSSSGGSSSGGGGTSSSGGGDNVIGSSGGGGGSSSSGDIGPACATGTANTTKQPVYLQIILDGSGSMDGYASVNGQPSRCNEGTESGGLCQYKNAVETDPLQNDRKTGKKWIAARDALKAFFDAKATENSDLLALGLVFFHSPGSGPSSSTVETVYDTVPLARLDAAHADALWSVIRPPRWPWGGTMLSDSHDQMVAALNGYTPNGGIAAGGRRAILMVTDGVPTRASTWWGQESQENANQKVRTRVVNALAADPSIATAVIGVGDPAESQDIYNPKFLSDLANVGGLAPAGCDPNWTASSSTTPCHLQVTPGERTADEIKAEIITAIEAIAGSLASCELTLNKTSPIEPSKVNVLYVDGANNSTQVPQNAENGWTYDNPADPSTVILHGEACDQLKADTNGRIDIIIGCPTGTDVVN